MMLPASQLAFASQRLPPEAMMQILAARVNLDLDDTVRTENAVNAAKVLMRSIAFFFAI
jgi:hypothetical protein